MNTLIGYGEKFGILKKSGSIQLGTAEPDKSTSNSQSNDLAPQPRPEGKSKSSSPNEKGNLTIDTNDTIFNSTIPPISPHKTLKTGPLDFAEQPGKRKRIVLGDKSSSSLDESNASVQSAAEVTESDLENTNQSVEREKGGSVTAKVPASAPATGGNDTDKDGFTEPRTKGQKNADRLRRKKEREREQGTPQQSQRWTGKKKDKKPSNAAKKLKQF